MRLLIAGGCGFLGRALSERARANGFDVTTLDRSGQPDLRLDLVYDESKVDLSGFDVVVNLAFDGTLYSVEAARRLIERAEGAQRFFMLQPPQDGSVSATLARMTCEMAKAYAEEAQVPLTIVKSARIFGNPERPTFVEQVRNWSLVPRGTCHIVSLGFFCDFMSEVLPAVGFIPPGNELVLSTRSGFSREMLANLVAAWSGTPLTISGEVNEAPLDPSVNDAFGLPVLSDDRLLTELRQNSSFSFAFA